MVYEKTPIKKPKVLKETKKEKGKKSMETTKQARVNSSLIQTIQSIVITILITGIVAFLLGMKYANKQHYQVQQAVNQAVSEVKK
jgi:ABC-type phosphate/phosphonate transport system permease subunit